MIAVLDGIAELDVESLRNAGQSAGSGWVVVAVIGRVPGDVVCHLTDGALVARAAESSDGLFQAAGNGRRAGLLEADDVAAEAEAEVAVVVAGDLLGRDVNFAVKEASAWSDFRLFYFFRSGRRSFGR